jgi:hypothetical protein
MVTWFPENVNEEIIDVDIVPLFYYGSFQRIQLSLKEKENYFIKKGTSTNALLTLFINQET